MTFAVFSIVTLAIVAMVFSILTMPDTARICVAFPKLALPCNLHRAYAMESCWKEPACARGWVEVSDPLEAHIILSKQRAGHLLPPGTMNELRVFNHMLNESMLSNKLAVY